MLVSKAIDRVRFNEAVEPRKSRYALWLDSDFPRTGEGRVYHLGLKHGELSNRILTVGDPSRATDLAQHLTPFSPSEATSQDTGGDAPTGAKVLRIHSERGFLTYTGYYKGVRLSIVAIGMGFSNMDFLVREGRECVDGDMYMIRFGSCGCLTELPVGSIVVPKASVAVTRNYDFDFTSDLEPTLATTLEAYRISKPAPSNPRLHSLLVSSLEALLPAQSSGVVEGNCVNASADSFYSSQGRITSFHDHNDHLLEHILRTISGLATLEMETFHLLHLAQSSRSQDTKAADPASALGALPPSHHPVASVSVSPTPMPTGNDTPTARFAAARPASRGKIFAASAQMVFASRNANNTFITPDEVALTQKWAGQACLDALARI